jgi:AraC family transcriptional regulator
VSPVPLRELTSPLKKIQPILAYAAAHLDEDVSLTALAAQAGLSVFHLQRTFSNLAGESPKQFTLRLRMGRAAVMLLVSDNSVLDIALSCGFQSHEVFCRTFRRRFGMTPSAYRERGFVPVVDASIGARHAAVTRRIDPCIGLYHINQKGRSSSRNIMTYSITKREISPQPVLLTKRRITRSEIAATIGQGLHQIGMYSRKNAIALTGPPVARYSEVSHGHMTIEPGMPVVGGLPTIPTDAGIVADTLPGGPVAFTTHCGSYDKLPEAYAAMEIWMLEQGLTAAGSPWESYVTDPGDYPDVNDWKTEVFWPIA